MNTKNKVLLLLEENIDSYISGQEIAGGLGVSRMAVWKAIHALKGEGYLIDSGTKKGYRLLSQNDILSEQGIRKNLENKYKDNRVLVLESTGSTNSDAKKLAIDGAPHGTIIVANEQTQGRGRFGRTFFSPKEKGIYLSLVLRPNMNIQEVTFSTILTVVAVCRAIKKFTDEKVEVKWVNDLYIEGRKVCGILTELVSDMESGEVDFIVVGVGMNVNAAIEDFPKELQEIAGSVHASGSNRNEIIAGISVQIMDIFENFSLNEIIQEYRELQMILGKKIRYEKNGETIEGIAKDIDQQGGLVVHVEGEDIILRSGEVSVRLDPHTDIR
ncbi:MAG: biotin--[acetyl-CoA-carboxylase] ligase [Peptostreptococcaceae bacterium]|nr:biotin--[acetyl-CoA-carboxylase] ligase [Peptostreptococcaceae bacterium]